MLNGERGPRGYIMIESVVSGALLAIALGTTLTLLGSYRVEVSMAAKRAEAAALASAKAEELMADAQVTTSGSETDPQHPSMSVSWSVTQSGLHGQSTPALQDADELHKITVDVTFPTSSGTEVFRVERLRRSAS